MRVFIGESDFNTRRDSTCSVRRGSELHEGHDVLVRKVAKFLSVEGRRKGRIYK